MIRLRGVLDAGLRHPLLGPLLLLFLALILAFVVVHTIEHGVEGALFSCVIVVVAALRLVVVVGRRWRATSRDMPLLGRAPPRWSLRLLAPPRITVNSLASPLRL